MCAFTLGSGKQNSSVPIECMHGCWSSRSFSAFLLVEGCMLSHLLFRLTCNIVPGEMGSVNSPLRPGPVSAITCVSHHSQTRDGHTFLQRIYSSVVSSKDMLESMLQTFLWPGVCTFHEHQLVSFHFRMCIYLPLFQWHSVILSPSGMCLGWPAWLQLKPSALSTVRTVKAPVLIIADYVDSDLLSKIKITICLMKSMLSFVTLPGVGLPTISEATFSIFFIERHVESYLLFHNSD